MKPIERFQAMLAGEAPDRWPFVPSIYEHGAAVLDKSPGEVSRDKDLMAEAAIESYRKYQHDLVTVGIDIYNVEAESFGCRVECGTYKAAIPGITSHPLEGPEMPDVSNLEIPKPGPNNRLGLITDATERVVNEIGDEVWVFGCVGGPFSQAVEMRGFDNLITDMALDPDSVHRLMEKTSQLALEQAERLAKVGASCYLYESWATIPLIDPTIFGTYVVPYNRRAIEHVRDNYDVPTPGIVMGGNISILIDFFLEAQSGLIVADYLADFDLIREKTADRDVLVRGCVDPKVIERGDWDVLGASIDKLSGKAAGMKRFLWGCGCVSYATPIDHMMRFKQMCVDADQSPAS